MAGAAAAPGLAVRLSGTAVPPHLEALLMGAAVIGAAFLLSWAAEVAQVDIPEGVAFALLALVAVLPEYAVDMVFAWKAGADPDRWAPLALANMTGANRLLIGVGWFTVVLVASRRSRPRRRVQVELDDAKRVEVGFLAVATAYSFTLPLRGEITLLDTLVLGALFAAYAHRLAHGPKPEPDLQGPPTAVASQDRRTRRRLTVGLFVIAAAVILAVAEPFADALVDTGVEWGVNRFLLVQWVAPLASETPELLAAGLLALRMRAGDGLGVLVSSKVNQWTLLVGFVPAVFAVSAGGLGGFPLDGTQRLEVFLTAAQSAFAVTLLARLRLGLGGAGTLFALFVAQLVAVAVAPAAWRPTVRLVGGCTYVALALVAGMRYRGELVRALRVGVLGRPDR